MSLILDEFYCMACSIGNCSDHRPHTTIIDSVSGLAVKVVCACPAHRKPEKMDQSLSLQNNGETHE